MPTHAERKIVPYRPEQLFELVAQVERYPEFLPWVKGARVRKREGDVLHADIIVGFKLFREHFSSKVMLDRQASRIDVEYVQGPMKFLSNHWVFTPHGDDKCEIDFFIDFEFHSRILQKAIELLFSEAVKRMVAAFEARALSLYGPRASISPG